MPPGAEDGVPVEGTGKERGLRAGDSEGAGDATDCNSIVALVAKASDTAVGVSVLVTGVSGTVADLSTTADDGATRAVGEGGGDASSIMITSSLDSVTEDVPHAGVDAD